MKKTYKVSVIILTLSTVFTFTNSAISISKPVVSMTTFGDEDLMRAMNDMMQRMNGMKMSGDFDHDFALMMIEHHQGAIDMSQVLLKSGKNEKLKSMAQKGSAKQKEGQKELRTLISNHKMESSKNNPEHNELKNTMEQMMKEMKSMKMSGDVDKDFAMMMMMHHKAGLEMANNEIAHGKDAELKKAAQKMVEEQKKEMKELQDWLNNK
jgi:uncharacterized protein (DUF305 family)